MHVINDTYKLELPYPFKFVIPAERPTIKAGTTGKKRSMHYLLQWRVSTVYDLFWTTFRNTIVHNIIKTDSVL